MVGARLPEGTSKGNVNKRRQGKDKKPTVQMEKRRRSTKTMGCWKPSEGAGLLHQGKTSRVCVAICVLGEDRQPL